MSLCNVIEHFLMVISFLICEGSRTVSEGVGGGVDMGGDRGCACRGWWSMTHPDEKVYK